MEAKTEYKLETLKVKYAGFFNFGEIIAFIKKWLQNEYYVVLEQKHKYKPKSQEVEFIGFRKLNEYVKYAVEITIKSEETKEVELVKEGKKLNTQEGKLVITLNGSMDLDWQKRFKGQKFLTFLQDFYHKYIIKQKIEEEWMGPFEKKVMQLRDDVKETFLEGD
ncbi:MAG: hypothetical protein Q8Q04_03220 [archaeon]|nr:hypothetical protein [archaeon]